MSNSDEVDRLVAAWRRERPELDVAPMEVLSRISRLARHLDRARRRAFASHDLEASEFDVLSALRRSGPPYQLSPGQLLHETMVTSGTMTHRVDRLIAKGLVTRLPDPADRRGIKVLLTAAGMRAVDGALDALLASETVILGELNTAQTDTLAAALLVLSLPFDSVADSAANGRGEAVGRAHLR